jgi:hypothetical protein
MEEQDSLTGADRVSAVCCYQQTANGWVPEKLRYPNADRNEELVYWDWDKDGGEPGPTFEQEVKEEIEAAKNEANNMCDVATSRGICCNEITITLVHADNDGAAWMQIYYNESIAKEVHKKTCDKSCEDRGGEWMPPHRRKK